MDRELTITLKDYLDQHEQRTLAQYQTLIEELRDIKKYQREQNGRVSGAEAAIAVLKDQAERAKEQADRANQQADRASQHASGGLLTSLVSLLALVGAAVWKLVIER